MLSFSRAVLNIFVRSEVLKHFHKVLKILAADGVPILEARNLATARIAAAAIVYLVVEVSSKSNIIVFIIIRPCDIIYIC